MTTVKDIITLLNEYNKVISVINNKDLNEKTIIINEIVRCIKKYEEYDINVLGISSEERIKNSRLKKINEEEKIRKISDLYYKYEENNNINEVDLNSVMEESNILYELVTRKVNLKELISEYDLGNLKLFELRFIYYILFNEYISRTKKEIISSLKKSISRIDYYNSFKSNHS